jgi:hypothetical protein
MPPVQLRLGAEEVGGRLSTPGETPKPGEIGCGQKGETQPHGPTGFVENGGFQEFDVSGWS